MRKIIEKQKNSTAAVVAAKVMASTLGVTAIAVVVAAPGKWGG